MTEDGKSGQVAAGGNGVRACRRIVVPAQAREEIGALAFYLQETLRNLREVNDHVRDSSQTMPGVFHELRDVVRMAEEATVRVLDETEALLEAGKTAAALVAEVRQAVAGAALAPLAERLGRVETLVDATNGRGMAIMAALEFQDLMSQRVQRAFGVLEDVASRLGKIQGLVDLGEEVLSAPDRQTEADVLAAGRSAQALADEILGGFDARGPVVR